MRDDAPCIRLVSFRLVCVGPWAHAGKRGDRLFGRVPVSALLGPVALTGNFQDVKQGGSEDRAGHLSVGLDLDEVVDIRVVTSHALRFTLIGDQLYVTVAMPNKAGTLMAQRV